MRYACIYFSKGIVFAFTFQVTLAVWHHFGLNSELKVLQIPRSRKFGLQFYVMAYFSLQFLRNSSVLWPTSVPSNFLWSPLGVEEVGWVNFCFVFMLRIWHLRVQALWWGWLSIRFTNFDKPRLSSFLLDLKIVFFPLEFKSCITILL